MWAYHLTVISLNFYSPLPASLPLFVKQQNGRLDTKHESNHQMWKCTVVRVEQFRMSVNISRIWCKLCFERSTWPCMKTDFSFSHLFLQYLSLFPPPSSHMLPHSCTHENAHSLSLSLSFARVHTQRRRARVHTFVRTHLNPWVSITFFSPSACVGDRWCRFSLQLCMFCASLLLYQRSQTPNSVCSRAAANWSGTKK